MAKKRSNTGYRVAVSGARRLVSLLLFTLVMIVIFFLGRTAYHFGYSVFHQVPVAEPPGENITVTIAEGADAREIGITLRNAGLIEDVTLFRVQERLSAYHKELSEEFKGGTFRLNTSQTTDEMLAVIAGEATEVQEVNESGTESDVRDPNAEEKLIEGVTNDSDVADPNAEDKLIEEVTNDTSDEDNPEQGDSESENAGEESGESENGESD
ncbi:MAG: hypothetical protein E7240_04150 [Lachnospiraceae bacterium]|nr:hypothetical protein [Lachnospiraceae bacterium]